jgi:hypothetical protein
MPVRDDPISYLLYAIPRGLNPARAEWMRNRPAWAACVLGREPAESLPTLLRAYLFSTMLRYGWTVAEIGAWTRTTEYTVTRVLERAG